MRGGERESEKDGGREGRVGVDLSERLLKVAGHHLRLYPLRESAIVSESVRGGVRE